MVERIKELTNTMENITSEVCSVSIEDLTENGMKAYVMYINSMRFTMDFMLAANGWNKLNKLEVYEAICSVNFNKTADLLISNGWNGNTLY
jgi:hypothetical protein